jgi:hypothetical protein
MKIMPAHNKALQGIASGIIVLWFGLLCPAISFSQNESPPPRALQVGVIKAAPLHMKAADRCLSFLAGRGAV